MHILPYLLSFPLSWLYKAWCFSLRLDETGRDAVEAVTGEGKSTVVTIWHDELFPFMAYKKHWRAMAVVSRSRDGDWLAGLLHRLDVGTVRGSSSRGGASALRQAVRGAEGGFNVVITVDGPRGPRHKAKPGAVHLASREGIPIVYARLFMNRCKKLGSWDRFQIPFPFSRVHVVWGTPYTVDKDLEGEALARACEDLEQRLLALEARP